MKDDTLTKLLPWGTAILENTPVTRSEDSTLFREISREIFAVRVGRTATCVGFREISREMLWPNARLLGRNKQQVSKSPVRHAHHSTHNRNNTLAVQKKAAGFAWHQP